MTAVVEMLVAMVTAVMATAVATMMTTTILRILHRRNYCTTIIATTTLIRQG